MERSVPVALLAAALVSAALEAPVPPVVDVPSVLIETNQSTELIPGVPTRISATTGPGRSHVSFTPADSRATSFTVTAWNGSTPAATATGATSPVLIWGLSYGSAYTFTVQAANSAGSSAPSVPSAAVRPTGPVTNATVVAADRRFVNQSTSFNSTAGTVSSRRPVASESPSAALHSPASQGVPAGKEWRLLWLRAVNCEAASRQIEFFVQREAPTSATVARFVQGDMWTAGQPNRTVAVSVAGGGELSWVESPGKPLILSAHQSIGVRWYGMAGGGSGCNWQFGAIEAPAGTGVGLSRAALPTANVGGTFKANAAGVRASWRTVPAGSYWLPESVTATNCEAGPRRMEVVLLGPGNITQGVVTPAGNGVGPVAVPAGGTFRWSASELRARLLLPEGWGIGVRWMDMAGNAPTVTCSWTASVSAGAIGASGTAFDATMR